MGKSEPVSMQNEEIRERPQTPLSLRYGGKMCLRKCAFLTYLDRLPTLVLKQLAGFPSVTPHDSPVGSVSGYGGNAG